MGGEWLCASGYALPRGGVFPDGWFLGRSWYLCAAAVWPGGGAARGITNVRNDSRYLSLARQRMVEELIQNRLQHQAEQIYGLNELIHQAMVWPFT